MRCTIWKKFGLFWYRFLIGDDWVGAAIIIAGLIGIYALMKAEITAHWLLPLVVMFSLSLSLFRQARSKPG
ncbi:MAG: hypothetical protein ACXU9P_05600 [Thermodesulfobacteriota bacterium]